MRLVFLIGCFICLTVLILGTMGCEDLTPEEKKLVLELRDQGIELHEKSADAWKKAEEGTITFNEAKELAAFYRGEALIAEKRIERIIDSAGERGLSWYEILGGVIGTAIAGAGGGTAIVRKWRGSIHGRKGDIGKT